MLKLSTADDLQSVCDESGNIAERALDEERSRYKEHLKILYSISADDPELFKVLLNDAEEHNKRMLDALEELRRIATEGAESHSLLFEFFE